MASGFQEIQHLVWWAALILFVSGILVPILFLSLGRSMAQRARASGSSVRRRAVLGVHAGCAVFAFVLSAAMLLCFGVMTTDVNPSEVRVPFGWMPAYTESIPIAEIRSASAVQSTRPSTAAGASWRCPPAIAS